MPYDIHVKEIPSQHVAARRKHVPFADLGRSFSETMLGIFGSIAPNGKWPTGPAFAIYYNQPFRVDDVDVEVGIPVAPDVELHDARTCVDTRDLPGARVAFTIHTGPYDGIGAAYDDLERWMEANGKAFAGPPREIYIVGPGQTDRPSEYVTEVEFPIA